MTGPAPASDPTGGTSTPVLHVERFADLAPGELYELLRLRVDAFVVEQRCPYPELDGQDRLPAAWHLWYAQEGTPVAYVRVVPGSDGGSAIGRVVTAPGARGHGLARRLVEHALHELDLPLPITLSAQAHLTAWYARSGFVPAGDGYLEDGIPHVPMRWDPPADADRPRSTAPPPVGDPRIVDWGRRLAAIGATGLHYHDPHSYEGERYREVLGLATEILAAGFDGADLDTVATALEGQQGYATPKVDVRGVVARQGRVLMVREAVDGRWTLPGGWADVGDSPSAAIEREVREEAGVATRAAKLLAVFDRARHGRVSPYPFRVYKMLFRCELVAADAEPCPDEVETTGADWFDLAAPPELSAGRTMPDHLRVLRRHLDDPDRPTDFD